MARIKDVAAESGVSTATVSRVLSDKPHVSADLRARVMAAVEKLGYRPNLIARSLRSQQSNIIGLIVSDVRNPYFTDVSRAVEDSAYEQGYSVFLCNTDENPEKEMTYLREMRDKNVAGVIFSPTRQTADNFVSLDVDLPIVMIDRTVRAGDVDSVVIGNEDAAYRLTQHLIENGYRKIAGVFGQASTTGIERQAGFTRALRESGLEPAQVIYTAPKTEVGHEAVRKLLQNGSQPDAIFTSNSLLAAGALQAIREAGLSIPHDVALVGFDDTTWATLVSPSITVIAQPTDEIGRMAVELLLQRLENPERSPRQVILRGMLLARGSSVPRQLTQP
jgi:LacI family fructose operon transcriptional repressor